MQCEALDRLALGRLWQPCPEPAVKVLVTGATMKAYCQIHLDKFTQVLPKNSYTLEDL